MPNNNRVNFNPSLHGAERSAKSFVEAEDKYRQLANRKDELIDEKLGGNISHAWRVMWPLAVLAAIGLLTFGAFAAQGAIAGLVDPLGKDTVPVSVLIMIGVTLSVFGQFVGHELNGGYQRNSNTGIGRISGSFWLYLLAALFYVGLQFQLSKTAGHGNSNDSFVLNMPLVIAGIAAIEVLFGLLLSERTFHYTGLFSIEVRQRSAERNMDYYSRITNDEYRQYINLLDEYIKTFPDSRVEREGNENIRRAIAYYAGINQNQNRNSNNNDSIPIANDDSNPTTPQNGNGSINLPNQGNNNHHDLESFLDDNIDDDLTM